jgi:outer membrane protein OmpA-like peptidoglycan-associated protein
MFDQEDSDLGVVIAVVFGVIALVISLVIGVGVYRLNAGGAAAGLASAGGDVTYTEVEEVGEPLVKLYFALGETGLPADANAPIDSVIEALQAAPEKKALLSGFHDETGTAAVNAEVARKRAIAVREALIIAGIPAQRVLLRRPAVTLGGADAAEARRVEVRVQ